jgi:drug/metabolite transporter (DMT)-like permease
MRAEKKETKQSMIWVMFALGAALAWGLYGPTLHRGQVALGSPMRALLCVGVAYFLIGVLFPLASLGAQGELNGFNSGGITWATVGGALGAGLETDESVREAAYSYQPDAELPR